MKNLSFLLAFTFTFASFNINAQWEDDFNDGNLHQNPSWYGDTSHFVINEEQLELNAENAGTSFLYAKYDLISALVIEWKFDVNLEFSPSQNNGFRYILFSSDSLYWSTNGLENSLCYYLKIGEIGAMDAVELYRKDSSQADPVLLCRGLDELVSSTFHRKYSVVYNDGTWTIKSALFNSPYYILEAEVNELSEGINDGYVGMELFYTSSNTNNFSFDAISVLPFEEDTIEAHYTSATHIDSLHLKIDFSEALDSSVLDPSNYFIVETMQSPNIVGFSSSEQSSVLLEFEYAFEAFMNLQLEVDNIVDINGNSSDEFSLNFTYSPEYEAKFGDLQFSEIMADPSPVVGLPNAEYIEIYNASDSILSIENYILVNSGSARFLPAFILLPNSYLILCKSEEEELFSDFGNIVGIENWITLLNTGDSLLLKNRSNQLLDKVNYLNTWYDNSLKSEGGWSLEKITFTSACFASSNWKESVAINGGSPGIENSHFGDEVDLEVFIGQIFLIDSNRIQMEVEGELDLLSLPTTMLSTSPPFEIEWDQSVIHENSIQLYCSPAFEYAKSYHLKWQNLKACNGEIVYTKEKTFAFPEEAEEGDVVINELLFNPHSGANDFIEILNNSNKYIDLNSWRINRMEDGLLVEDAQISNSTLIIAPSELLAFSKDIEELPILYSKCSPEQLRNLYDLPNFSDESGKVVLVNQNFKAIDSLEYNEDMHFSLLEDVNGVSLERIHPKSESATKSSWASASQRDGYASPGDENSQYWEIKNRSLEIIIEPEVFSPNNDGNKDYMFINYAIEEGAWQSKVTIYSKDGLLVKNLIVNELVSGKGVFKWNGLDNNDELLNVGIYIVYFEIFNNKGEVLIFKKPCVIGSEL